jgi:deazaflavin-dependent oxidoreductase (nitroreductase family)
MAERKRAGPLLKAFLALHVFLYRISKGRIGNRMRKAPVLLLTVKGRKSGKKLTFPLLYVTTDKGYAVVASFAGAPQNPAWYLNLEAAKAAEIQIGGSRIRVRAETVEPNGERYRRLWDEAAALYPDYNAYRTRTTRTIPIVELVPAS